MRAADGGPCAPRFPVLWVATCEGTRSPARSPPRPASFLRGAHRRPVDPRRLQA